MKKSFSYTHLLFVVLLLGILCLEGCSLYHNFIWYEPSLLDENGKVDKSVNIYFPEDNDQTEYFMRDYYTKTTANAWLILFLPFIPLGEDYDGPHLSCHTGDFVIWTRKDEECPVVYVDGTPAYGKILEDEPYDVIDLRSDYNLCHYGNLPIEDRQIYTIKYKGEEKRYLFVKKQWLGYIPFWVPSF